MLFSCFVFETTGNKIGNSGAYALAKILQFNETLTHLNLSCELCLLSVNRNYFVFNLTINPVLILEPSCNFIFLW